MVVFLSVITLGIYSLYWWHEINREMRDLGYARGVGGFAERPGLSALAFSGLSVFTLYVSFVWTIVATSQRVGRAQEAVGTTQRLNGWISAALWIFTLTFGGMAYTQSQLNKVWALQEAAEPVGGEVAAAPPIEDPELWPSEHPAIWDSITRRAYRKRYGRLPGT